MRTVFIMFPLLLSLACSKETCRKTGLIEKQEVNIRIKRLEKELFAASSPQEVREILLVNPDYTLGFLDGDQYPNIDILADKIYQLYQDAYIDTLYTEASEVYADISGIKQQLEEVVGRLQTLFPEEKSPDLVTTVTGMYNDLLITDSLIIVGIDYFIGDEATYRPINIPNYMLKRYDREHLVPIIAKFMATTQVSTSPKNTLLSEMIDFGKTYYLTSRLLPCVPDSILMGYSAEEMEAVVDNEKIIWANFVENKILYETSHFIKQKFLGERPNIHEISAKCPGRVGAWIGWQIVEDYMRKNKEVDILTLLDDTDHDKIFSKSGFKPK
ncbi:MAG: gliding motility lipoprotein GldB [Bacteroidota bacterium]